MLHTKFHPLTGDVLKPIYVSKSGREFWPIIGASEPVVEPTITIPVATPPAPAAPVFSAEDIAKARQEEKDKLYKTLKDQKDKIDEFDAFKASFQAEAEASRTAAADAARAEAEEVARKKFEESDAKTLLADATSQWEAKFASLQAERETERALFDREQQFNTLKTYAGTKVQEALSANLIAPELADFVSGNTQEEIDASLEFVKAKSSAIVENIAQAQVQARANMRGVSTAGFSTTGPLDTDSGHKTYTAADLAGLSMNEYAKIRGSLLPGLAAQQQNRGLYG